MLGGNLPHDILYNVINIFVNIIHFSATYVILGTLIKFVK